MMTKTEILQVIEEAESWMTKLRRAVEQLSDATEATSVDVLAELEAEDVEEGNDLDEVFSLLRQAWNIPPDVRLDLPLVNVQQAMSEGLPENWASREIIHIREE